MRLVAMLLCLAIASAAASVSPDYIGIKDTGNQGLPKLDVAISLDCGTKAATVTVNANGTGLPVQGAKTYMFYTDYGYNALPNPGTTGADGTTVMPVTGNIRYLTALFVLRTDAQGYQSREIEFTYEKCFEPVPPEQNETPSELPPPAQNATAGMNQTEANTTPVQQPNATTPSSPPSQHNVSGGEANATAPGGPTAAPANGSAPVAPSSCPGAAAVLGLALVGAARCGS